jgi:hypothetical protein
VIITKIDFVNLNENMNRELEKIYLKYSTISETLIRDAIANDPKMLEVIDNIKNLVLVDKERVQHKKNRPQINNSIVLDEASINPKARRLDLLFKKSDSNIMYEVEIQLGEIDSHLGRTLIYRTTEQKKNEDYEHIAVIVAECITDDCLNLIELLREDISIIVIKMEAYKIEENKIGLHFKPVIRKINPDAKKECVISDEVKIYKPKDREYWEKHKSKTAMTILDHICDLVNPKLEINYTQGYVRFNNEKFPSLFVEARKNSVIVKIVLNKSTEIEDLIKVAGLNLIPYKDKSETNLKYHGGKNGTYQIEIIEDDIRDRELALKDLFKSSYEFTCEKLTLLNEIKRIKVSRNFCD